MTKIVYNRGYGGFILSDKAIEMYLTISGGKEPDESNRTDPILIEVVEKLGKEASGLYSCLKIRELPPGTLYRIKEYDGMETIVTRDQDTHHYHIA